MTTRPPFATLAALTVALVCAAAASSATAQQSGDATHDAVGHFQRGVGLYGETDYRAALVEFRRAYSIVPNAAVLYNIGETQYQLRDYAGALTTFTHYLAEVGPNEAHRTEVVGTIDVLRARVGHLAVTTDPPGADVAIDDQPVGKTPLDDRVLVSIGRRKVSASMTGRLPVTRFVDVAAADSVAVKLSLPAATSEVPPELSTLPPPAAPLAAGRSSSAWALRAVGWTATGVLAAGASVSGVLALHESKELSSARSSYPITAETLTHEAALTTAYSVVADSLTAAALVVGGITLFSTVSAHARARAADSVARVWVGPASAHFEMTFF